jgi:hypothetical protein
MWMNPAVFAGVNFGCVADRFSTPQARDPLSATLIGGIAIIFLITSARLSRLNTP